ncbi:MAG: hypothetical protein VW443_09705 [Pseudomonadales bacterium]
MFGLMKKKSPEEVIERQGGASYKGKPGETIRIVGGDGNSDYRQYQNQNWNVMDNGDLSFGGGVFRYKWNDKFKRYDAKPGHGKGYLKIGQVNPQEEDEEEGSGSQEQSAPVASIMNVGTPGGVVIPGTYEGGSGGSVGLLQISPGAVNWQPQVGTLNPLADPNNFYANLAPIQMPQEQRYIDPSLMLI